MFLCYYDYSKNNNIKYRIGAGVRKLLQVGYRDYNYWQHTFNVNKYYDEWGTVQPNNVFVVKGSGSVREWDDTEYVSITKNEFNVNFAVDFYCDGVEYGTLTSFCFSFGFNTKGGINVGFGFPLF